MRCSRRSSPYSFKRQFRETLEPWASQAYTVPMPSLYSTYRPQKFSQLVGQTHITRLLKAELSKNLAGHAYLFIGPRGTGKTTTARILAKALNCTDLQTGEPCGICSNCKTFDAGKFIDLIEIDAASNRGIDEIRELKERIEYNPSIGKQKVYIVDEVHMLTKEAFNALLKTLEEPPSYVTFILATTEPHKIPATIMSRCEKFEFKLGGQKEIANALHHIMDEEKVKVDKKGMDLLVTHSGGSYRDAVSLLDTIIASTGDKELTFEEVSQSLGLPDSAIVNTYIVALAENKLADALGTLDEVFSRGTNVPQFTKSIILLLRDCLLDKTVAEEVGTVVAELPKQRLTEMIKVLLEAYNSQRYAFDHRLPLQLATAQLISDDKSQGSGSALVQTVRESTKPEKVIEHVEQIVSKMAPESTNVIVKKKLMKKKKKQPQAIVGKALTIDEVRASWGQFTRAVQKEVRHLYTFLVGAFVMNAEYDEQLHITKVELQIPFDFHKKQLESPKNQVVVHTAANAIYGTPVQFVYVVGKDQIVFKKQVNEVGSMVSPTLQTVKIEATPQESPLESAFDSVLGADVEVLA